MGDADMSELYRVERDGAVALRLHVQPGTARADIAGRRGDALKVKVTAPAEGGRANAAVTRLLAESLGVRPTAVTIVSGTTGRRKLVRIHGVAADRFAAWLGRVAGA